MNRKSRRVKLSLCAVIVAGIAGSLMAQQDPYETYVKTSKDFRPVKQSREMSYNAWPSWVYMPWYYQWSIGFDDAAGKFCQDMGYNGGFTDHGDPSNLNWFNKFNLRFYMDHTAGKGDLCLRDGKKLKGKDLEILRPVPVDNVLKSKLERLIKQRVSNVKSSPMRAAYAVDDEISWSTFLKPAMWQITPESNYRKWLDEKYGAGNAPANKGWIGYNDVRPLLSTFTLGTFNVSQLMDQWSFNDSWWLNFLGDLVEYSNTIDPVTPAGFVGGQAPNAFGGFDYAKMMRKIQFLESYWSPENQVILQSFNPNQIPIVSTHFHQNSRDTVWQFFTCLAHGNRGHIGWVEKWFDVKEPKPFHKEISPTLLELGKKLGPLQAQAEMVKSGVMMYYSQASLQMSWIMDAQTHGKTWPNRGNDAKLGTSHLSRRAWVNMLRDDGLQPTFLSYVDLIQGGIPKDCKVLILPAVFCLSNVEAVRIKEFCKGGGTVIADFLPGVFDQNGKGRPAGGVLDDLFGVKHDPGIKAEDLFQGKNTLWVEVNQDAHFSYKTFRDFLSNNDSILDASGFNKAVRKMEVNKVSTFGAGKAVLMNLSPNWYNAYRQGGFEEAKKRDVFMKYVRAAGVKRVVEIENAGDKEFGYEVVCWKKNGRTILFVVSNPDVAVDSLGGGNSVGLKKDEIEVTLRFAAPISGVRDERAGKDLPGSSSFKLKWKMNEAIVLSYKSEK